MAIGVSFDESNMALSPPEGVSEDEVYSLSVLKTIILSNNEPQPVVISCWKVSQEELDEIIRTKRIWLLVMGKTMPPVCVEGIKPEMKRD